MLDAEEIRRILRRMASSIVEQSHGVDRLALVGVRRGGVGIARRLATLVAEVEARPEAAVALGTIDITLYRDDASTALPDPKIGPSQIPFDPMGRDVVLVDDVLQTGRTVRAAIDCLLDYGRPRRVWLAVLCDRGGRELPVAADFVGRRVEVPEGARLEVSVGEDEPDRAEIVLGDGGAS